MKIVAVIPAHMASVRFPGKILFPFYGLPMIEHVRRRALLSQAVSDVIVATCDDDIASAIWGFGGKVVMTADTHKNGTTRVAEAVRDADVVITMLPAGPHVLKVYSEQIIGVAPTSARPALRHHSRGPLRDA